MTTFTWSRHPEFLTPGYEVSTVGDKRFSALHARIGYKTIEQAYQLDVKGYRKFSDDWRTGKGKPTLRGQTREQLFTEYLDLWRVWADNHARYMGELRAMAAYKSYHLTDQFATSEINQAHALCVILNETQP